MVIYIKLQVDRHTDIIWDEIYLSACITVRCPYASRAIRLSV